MMRRGSRVAALVALSMSLSGCAALLIGAGVAGGYAISKDSVRNQFDLSKEAVYQQSLTVAKEAGFVTLEDGHRGLIKMKVGDSNVTITVKSLTKRSTELKVRGRNPFMLPDVDAALMVYNKIIERL